MYFRVKVIGEYLAKADSEQDALVETLGWLDGPDLHIDSVEVIDEWPVEYDWKKSKEEGVVED